MALTKAKLIADGVIDVDNLAAGHSITTSNIGEGSNLYYTDARVASYLTTNSYATESFVTTGYLPLSGGTVSGNLTVTGSLTGTLATASQTNITSVGTLSSLAVSGNVIISDTTYAGFGQLQIGNDSTTTTRIQMISSPSVGSGGIHFGDTTSATNGRFAGFLLYDHNGDFMRLGTAEAERMRITSSGNVGIGTSSPVGDGTALNLYGSTASTLKLQTALSGTAITDGGEIVMYDNDLIIKNREAGYIQLATSGTERMRITSAGAIHLSQGTGNSYVGTDAGNLGTSTGSYNTAFGDISLYSNTSGNFNSANGVEALQNNTTGSFNIANGFRTLLSNTTGNNNIAIGYNAGNALTTGSNNTIIGNVSGTAGLSDTVIIAAGTNERMRIDSSGNVGIGTSSPSHTLHVGNGSATNYIRIQGSLSDSYVGSDSVGTFLGNTTSSPIYFVTNSVEKMRIDSSGNVGIGASVPANKLHVIDAITQAKFEGSVQGNIVINKTGFGGVSLYSGAAGRIGIYNNDTGTNIATFDSDGLKFKNDTAAANALDDYEEGTWTPGFTLQGGSVSSFSSSGTYIKIGRQVSIKLFIVFTSTSSASVDNITNFPFVAQNTSEQAVGSIRENAATGSQWHIRINNNNNEGLIRRYDNSASISNGFTFVGTLTYFTA